MKTIKTALSLIKILTNSSTVTAKQLSKECGISQRSVYRYIDELTVCGIPVNTSRGHKGGISMDEDYKKRNYNYSVNSPDYIRTRRCSKLR